MTSNTHLTTELYNFQQQLNTLDTALNAEQITRLQSLITRITTELPENSRTAPTFTTAVNNLQGRISAGLVTPEDLKNIRQITIVYLRSCNDKTIEHFLGLDSSWQPGESKDVATEKILDCFRNDEQDLSLTELSLSSLPPKLFHYLPQLRTLNLDYNELHEIPDLSSLANLESLNLSYNKLQNLPDLSKLVNLKLVFLERNQLQKVPELSNLTNLEELFLNGNELQKVPSFSNLVKLKILKISDNQLREISDLSHLTNLEELFLNGNELPEAPGLSSLLKLKILNLSGNRFQELPDTSTLRHLTRYTKPSLNVIFSVESFKKKLSTSSTLRNFDETSLKVADPDLFKNIINWLAKLNGTDGRWPAVAEFSSTNEQVYNAFSEKVLSIIELASREPGFRPILKATLDIAATACEDKAAFYLNSLDVQRRIFDLKNEQPSSLIPILKEAFILDFIENEITLPFLVNLIQTRPGFTEDVEVALDFQIALKEGLVTTTMGHRPHSPVTPQDIAEAHIKLREVLRTHAAFLDYLCKKNPSKLSPTYLWQEKLKKDFRPEFDAILEPFSEEMEALMMKEVPDTEDPTIQRRLNEVELVAPTDEITSRKVIAEQTWIREKTEQFLLLEKERSATSTLFALKEVFKTIPFYTKHSSTRLLAKDIQKVRRKYKLEESTIRNNTVNNQLEWFTGINDEIQNIKDLLDEPRNAKRKTIFDQALSDWLRLHPLS